MVPTSSFQVAAIAGDPRDPDGAKLLQGKLHDLDLSLRGILRGFGLKVGKTTPRTFAARMRELGEGHPTLETIASSFLKARDVLASEFAGFEPQAERPACPHAGDCLRL